MIYFEKFETNKGWKGQSLLYIEVATTLVSS